ncbi:PTS sugar transporter subunit IIA [Chlamydiifrater phoenicopteri]|uniref:PTS sugar transporter subunit IIA n=1 Tax=Chlamydiifrater phoenicopteri TaxID=2681469 RepID=UPI001BCBA59C|nr:PTS sugar transporter subunit IIA [Chlamydiifrater phoenicopteri]
MDLSVSEIADLLDVSEQTVQDWVKEGKIPGYSIKDECRFGREELENWLLYNSDIVEKAVGAESPKEGIVRDLSLKYSLYKAIHKGGVFNNIAAESKESVLQQVSNQVAQRFSFDGQVLFELLCQRESIMSTGIGQGIAIPHTREFQVNPYYDVVVAVFLKEPIDYKALDNRPVDTLFFLFAGSDKTHLNLINKIVHLGMDLDVRKFLKSFPDKEQLLSFVKAWESQTR